MSYVYALLQYRFTDHLKVTTEYQDKLAMILAGVENAAATCLLLVCRTTEQVVTKTNSNNAKA